MHETIVIGGGSIAHAHVHAVNAHGDRARVAAVVDVDADRARAFADEMGVPHATTDLAAALAGLDGVRPSLAHICTPPGTHVPLATQCLEAGVPVLVEKPPALSLAELDELLAVSERTGVDVAVVFQHRFGHAGLRVAGALGEGRPLGRPLVAVCDTLWFRGDSYWDAPWRGSWEVEGGGPTMGHGIHQMDLLLALLGPWEEVTAMAARRARPTKTEDVSAAVVRFADGTVATVMNSLLSPRETSFIRIDAEAATVEVEHLYGYTDQNWRLTAAPGREDAAAWWVEGLDAEAPGSGHGVQVGAILDALDASTTLPVSLREARDTLDLVAAIYASAFTGRPVRRGEITEGNPSYTSMAGPGTPW
ncbi:Gfo/Idh/MocA family protein [Cellulomonas telluris]|uniref:Gfo/Idh/MocA family protein n=1 Tax=Cellulomonas telluris TaxID=2306636 RepID=UPI0010A940CC|nr:Gfo/Idh/MocA family oxidoreductase [Cellulomonas telluris]